MAKVTLEDQTKMTVPDSPDCKHGSFSPHGPWVLDISKIEWLPLTTNLRSRSKEQVPRLINKTVFPPAQRVIGTGLRLGAALTTWRIFDRPKGPNASRSGLSRRLHFAFEALGPTYIKLGQIISAGEGLFPDELVSEFKLLRDRVHPQPFDIVRRTIEEDLSIELEDLFSEFESEPIAAASIAQVHLARLRTGEQVVVKVQRSNVANLVRKDLAAMSWIAPHLVGRIPVAALANPPAFIELFAETIVEELDFRLEAANMLDIAKILADTNQRSIIVPRPHPKYVTKKVLVMERLAGYKWDDVSSMRDAGIDTREVLRAALVSFLEGAILYGIFHGDLHGGNLFVQPDGKVALLDFGMTGRLGENKRLAFLRLLFGGSINNVQMQVAALRDLGALPKDTDIPKIIQELGLDRPAQDPTKMSPDELISEIRDITKALLGFGANLPKELILFVKNMLFLNASIAYLAPDIDLFAEIMYLVNYFTSKHGALLSEELGMNVTEAPVTLEGVKGTLGLDESVTEITYKELQERRELIRRRMQEHNRSNRSHKALPSRLIGKYRAKKLRRT